MHRRHVAATAVVALLVASCTTTEPVADDSGPTGDILVSAAASLVDAFSSLEEAFESRYPGTDVIINLAGSSTLREQIMGGVPADVFAAADTETMDAIVDAGHAAGDPMVFAHNVMQIAVPRANAAGVTGLDDLAEASLFIGLCAPQVPCGRYARQVLANADVTPAIDTHEPDVQALLTKVEEGELDAAIVYQTDVFWSVAARGIEIPAELNVTARYPIVALAEAPNPKGAAAFVDFVLSEDGRSLVRAIGFLAP